MIKQTCMCRANRSLGGLSGPFTVALASLAALMLAGCGGGGDSASTAASGLADAGSARFDQALEDQACSLVNKEMVAATFGLPVAEIERPGSSSSKCKFEWQGDDRMLNVLVSVNGVYENAAAARDMLNAATQDMSARELSDAMTRIKAEAELETPGERQAAEGISSSFGAGGLSFVEVAGVGDQARFGTRFGVLNVRVSNLYFGVEAYLGPGMVMPDKMTVAAIQRASKAWMHDSMPQRKEDAAKLARAIVAAL